MQTSFIFFLVYLCVVYLYLVYLYLYLCSAHLLRSVKRVWCARCGLLRWNCPLTFGVSGVGELVLPHADGSQHLQAVACVLGSRIVAGGSGRRGGRRGRRLSVGQGQGRGGQGGRGHERVWGHVVTIAHEGGAVRRGVRGGPGRGERGLAARVVGGRVGHAHKQAGGRGVLGGRGAGGQLEMGGADEGGVVGHGGLDGRGDPDDGRLDGHPLAVGGGLRQAVGVGQEARLTHRHQRGGPWGTCSGERERERGERNISIAHKHSIAMCLISCEAYSGGEETLTSQTSLPLCL